MKKNLGDIIWVIGLRIETLTCLKYNMRQDGCQDNNNSGHYIWKVYFSVMV